MSTKTTSRSFSGGEITPEAWGRIDLAKYQNGLATSRNMVITPHGPAINRAGTKFIKEVKDSTKKSVLIPFTYNNAQTFAIEIAQGYFRWFTQGSYLLAGSPAAYSGATTYAIGDLVVSSAVNYYSLRAGNIANTPVSSPTFWYAMPADGTYEIPNSYAEADLPSLHYAQNADIITLVHSNYAPAELKRYGATNWQLVTINFAPLLSAPTAVTATATLTGTTVYQYIVTAIATSTLEETVQSTSALSGTAFVINAFTKANPGVGTTTDSHGFAVNDPVFITGIVGMTQVSGFYLINTVPIVTTFTLKDLLGNPIDTTGFSTYTSGGIIVLAAIKNDLTVVGHFNTITWANQASAVRFNIYKYINGLWGYIGQAAGTSFVDNNITPNIGITPPLFDVTFASTGNYPAACSYFEQRRCFAGTNNQPQNLWMTRSGTDSNVGYTIPSASADAIRVKVAALKASQIQHIVPLSNMLMLTQSGEWRVTSVNSDAITPSSISIRPQSYIGSNYATPQVVGNSVLYAQANGGRIREMSYNWQVQSFLTNDISILAPHLFDFNTIVSMAFSRAIYPIVWAVSSNGKLLGMTYVPEQQVAAWHQHDTTNGLFESVCTVTENGEDVVYVIVKRIINGVIKRYVEVIQSRQFTTLSNAYFVDCGSTYNGVATTTITGLTWLEGQTVNILADGAVHPQRIVTGGSITLDQAASVVQVGLPITADIKTLPPSVQMPDFSWGRPKNVNRVWLRVLSSSGIKVGPDFNSLVQAKVRTNELYGTPPALITDEIEVVLDNQWSTSGIVVIRQDDPLPLTLISLTLEMAIGG